MPNLVIANNVPQALLDRIVDAFVERQGPIPMTAGTPAVLDGQGQVVTPAVPPAPMYTPAEFARRKIMDHVKSVVRLSEREVASKVQAEAAAAKADDDFKSL